MKVVVWEMDGSPPAVQQETVVANTPGNPRSLSLSDLDGDGDLDILLAAENYSGASGDLIWYENGNGWAEHAVAADFNQCYEVAAADLDGNGFNDVAGTSWSSNDISSWLNGGGTGWQDGYTFSIVSSGSKGEAVKTGVNGFTYTPDANENGSDTFTYKLNDGTGDSNTATVTVSIARIDDEPTLAATASNPTFTEGGAAA